MSFFKKIGKGISSAFKKAPGVISNIFKKGEGIASQVGSGLGKVAEVLGSVASNPLVEGAASAVFGPEAGIGLAGLGQLSKQIKDVSGIAKTASGVSGALSRGDVRSGLSGIQRIAKTRGVDGHMDGVSFA
jgi:hypothetical protein